MKWLLPFLCLSAAAQPFNATTGLPFLAPNAIVSAGITTNLAQVAYRWVATDLATNTAVVSWTDQVQSVVYTNGATANRPTNSSDGVWFDSSHWLSNASFPLTSNCSFGFIIDVVGFSGTHPQLLSSRNESVCLNNPELGWRDGGTLTWPFAISGGCTAQNLITNKMDGLTNFFIDLIVSQSVTNSGGTPNQSLECWTNSIVSSGYQGAVANGLYFGNPAGPIQLLGRNEFRASGNSLRIKEFWIWTNSLTSSALLDQTLVNAFHNYGTNVYHY